MQNNVAYRLILLFLPLRNREVTIVIYACFTFSNLPWCLWTRQCNFIGNKN